MDQTFNPVTLVFLLGATQGLFLALLLFNKTGNKTANRFLALLMIAYSGFIVEAAISRTRILIEFPHLLGLAAGVVYLIGPLHYLYARSLMSDPYFFSKKQLLHFLPFFIFYLTFLFPFYLQDAGFKLAYYDTLANEGKTPLLILFNWLLLGQGISYMILTLILLRKHSADIKESFSSIEKINLNWLRNITLMSLVVWFLGLTIDVLQIFKLAPTFDLSVPIFIALLIYAMGYLGLRQPEIFSGVADTKESKKYERSGLTEEKAQLLYEKLVHLMETKKPYTDSNLKLGQLAKMLAASPNHLSQVINEQVQQNFFDFINSYRIKEARRLIKDSSYQQLKLLSIAYDVGFNSKSAFNASFKKHTQMTPSQFRDQAVS
jgi:AraC-like DNA-binding protein